MIILNWILLNVFSFPPKQILHTDLIFNYLQIAKWRPVEFFFQLYEFPRCEIYKFIYLLSYIEHSWRFMRILLNILKVDQA